MASPLPGALTHQAGWRHPRRGKICIKRFFFFTRDHFCSSSPKKPLPELSATENKHISLTGSIKDQVCIKPQLLLQCRLQRPWAVHLHWLWSSTSWAGGFYIPSCFHLPELRISSMQKENKHYPTNLQTSNYPSIPAKILAEFYNERLKKIT